MYCSDVLQARSRQPYLRRFVNDWATEDMVKQYLRNRRAYARRHGFDKAADDDNEVPMQADEEDEGEEMDDNHGEGPSGTQREDTP